MINIIPPKPLSIGSNIQLHVPTRHHKILFHKFKLRNKEFHQPWVYIPEDARYFDFYLNHIKEGKIQGFFVFTNERKTSDQKFVGVINLNNIRLNPYGSASLGYYCDETMAGKGYVKEALVLVLKYAFENLHLNRVEANIQPGNIESLGLVKSLGFVKEGFSRKYLMINSRYQDHERWAYLAEDFINSKWVQP